MNNILITVCGCIHCIIHVILVYTIIKYHTHVYTVSVIGTAVGTGLNAHKDFGDLAAHYMSLETGYSFRSAPNKFYSLAAHDALVGASAAIRMLASGLFRIANDVR